MSFAFVFPGQGSQSLGMLAALGESCPEVRDTFTEASDALGYDLWALCQQGPETELNRTEKTQPALLTAGVAVWRAWQAAGGASPVMLAGHSLGEYTALVAAGALDFATAVKLVEFRGQAMQAAVPDGQGAMAAILGLDDAEVAAACAEAAQSEVVSPVNYNSPGQVVIAGTAAAVARAIEACKARGAKRAVPLPVSVPSHCSLMQPAAARLAERLTEITVHAPQIPVLHNVDVQTHADPAAICAALVAQLHNPVRWVETVQALAQAGVRTLLEGGPGKVLAGLTRRIDKELTALPVFDPDTLAAALTASKG